MTVKEELQYDHVYIMFVKYDEDCSYINGADNVAQVGAPLLADAEFTFKFYLALDGDYASVEPLRI